MKKRIFTIIVLLCSYFAYSQKANDNDILLEVGNDKVRVDEFNRVYTKNNADAKYDKQSLEDYMQLFINFKLKVIEAQNKGLDTLPSFKTELQNYRSQLEKPYLTNSKFDDVLVKEAYERMQFNIKASHILIRCSDNANPDDTLKAYNKINKIRKESLQKGADFGELAKKYSEDPSAQHNSGNLGYFSAFYMVYPFETGAYNTKVGQVSDIVRTRFGYHIIKVVDKQPNKGQIQVAHLMLLNKNGKEEQVRQKAKANKLYEQLIKGENFNELVKNHSDDEGTRNKGGVLPYFGIGRMVPEFEQAAFAIKEIGGYSKPIQTRYGIHIIKLLHKKPLAPFEEMQSYIKKRVSKDMRANKGQEKFIEELKKEYNFKLYKTRFTANDYEVNAIVKDDKWNCQGFVKADVKLFVIAKTEYSQNDFCKYLSSKRVKPKSDIQALLNSEYEKYISSAIIDYEKARLEDKYPDFRHLIKEYHDGILLFNLSNKEVWEKATTDTLGLTKFYEANKTNYMWDKRVKATIYTFNNSKYASKVSKLALKIAKKHADPLVEVSKLSKKIIKKDTSFVINVEQKKFVNGEDAVIDSLQHNNISQTTITKDGKTKLIYINGEVKPEPKLLNEARGVITADYQNYLEQEWIKYLRKKYKVDLKQEVFEKLIK